MNKYIDVAGIVGNPSFYGEEFRDYSDETMRKMRLYGFNTVFVNIAWSRPHIDAVVPEHIAVSKKFPLLSPQDAGSRFKLFKERTVAAKKSGMRTFALFGIPEYRDYSSLPPEYGVLKGAGVSPIDPSASVTCISRPEVLDLYAELLTGIVTAVPELDGMLIYNVDELADVCSEDSDCPFCAGTPLENRLPAFLNGLFTRVRSVKPDFEMWWEPWELSASQVYGIMKDLDTHIGICCHSTINEVYFINEGDTWIRQTARMAKDQERKFIVELFIGGSGEDIGIVAGYPCPRLVYRQLLVYGNIPGICSLKEYFGNAVPYFSVNEKVFAACVNAPDFPRYEDLIIKIAGTYSEDGGAERLAEFWDLAGRAIEMIPWELSWVMRLSNYPSYFPGYWGRIPFCDLMRTPWKSPSWLSSRRSYYIISENTANYNHVLARDVNARFALALEYIDGALKLLPELKLKPGFEDEFARQKEALSIIKCQLICRKNHLMLSESASFMREGKEPPYDVAATLENDRKNAEALRTILENSGTPYLRDYGFLRESQNIIDACIKVYRESPGKWLTDYHF
ncbi:MAG: hypothetical protein J5912_09095 [Clostridia bacterium]|nr:hypothetical protein [Clostridia bacterium]